METFSYALPTHFERGEGSAREAGPLVAHYGGTKALVLFGSSAVLLSGLVKRVLNSLDRSLLDHVVLGGFRSGEQVEMVAEGIPFARDERVDFVLAIGGAAEIDAAKLIAAGAAYEGEFTDFLDGRYEAIQALPLGCLLTEHPMGAEASPDAFIMCEGKTVKHARSTALTPAFSIIDPEVINSFEHASAREASESKKAVDAPKWAELTYTTV